MEKFNIFTLAAGNKPIKMFFIDARNLINSSESSSPANPALNNDQKNAAKKWKKEFERN